jgi:hypothetical protein
MPCSKFIKLFVYLFCFLSVSVPLVAASSDSGVPVDVTEADNALVMAYEAVLKAENVGANVSVLLDRLNVGGEYLSEAYFWANFGDYERANLYAGLCSDTVTSVNEEAVLLEEYFEGLENENFLGTLFFSSFGVAIVLVAGFIFWCIFKRNYVRRILSLKPEVVSGES